MVINMLSIEWLVQEGNKYIIKGREADWKKFCKENISSINVAGIVLFALQSLNNKDCNYKMLYKELKQHEKSQFINNYIENMIVKYAPRGYEFVTSTCFINEERKRIIDKIEKSNSKYKNKSR